MPSFAPAPASTNPTTPGQWGYPNAAGLGRVHDCSSYAYGHQCSDARKQLVGRERLGERRYIVRHPNERRITDMEYGEVGMQLPNVSDKGGCIDTHPGAGQHQQLDVR